MSESPSLLAILRAGVGLHDKISARGLPGMKRVARTALAEAIPSAEDALGLGEGLLLSTVEQMLPELEDGRVLYDAASEILSACKDRSG